MEFLDQGEFMLEIFFTSKVRIKILKLFLLSTEERFHVREITRQTEEEINAVRRELQRLYKAKLLGKEKRGNRLYYFLKPNFLFYPELHKMLIKDFGLVDEIRKKSKDLGKIKYVALTYELFNKKDTNHKDVDILLVGDVSLELLEKVVVKYEKQMKREINYSILSVEEFLSMSKNRSPFLINFLKQEVIVILGDRNKFFDINP